MRPRSSYHSILDHEIHVTEWGDPNLPKVVMWHGLSRTGRDFDPLAQALAPHFHVMCPDTIGRGLSTWSNDPPRDYTVAAYLAHAVLLMDSLGVVDCAWVGTSMGGILGMGLAAGAMADRITRLVLNDIGGEIGGQSLERIRDYLLRPAEFHTMTEFEAHIRKVHAPFGPHTDSQWRNLAETSVRRNAEGNFTNHYDPKVIEVFASNFTTAVPPLWETYDKITCPTLVVRGECSDLLLECVANDMTKRGPKARLVTVPDCGHAPALNTEEQIRELERFLKGN